VIKQPPLALAVEKVATASGCRQQPCSAHRGADDEPFPSGMSLVPRRRNPIRLDADSVAAVLNRPVPKFHVLSNPAAPLVSVVVVTFNNLLFTRMCLESLLANTRAPHYEVLVVDNDSTDGTPEYLRELAARHRHMRIFLNDANIGFAAANNQALKHAAGESFVLLNNDTITPRGWLTALGRHLDEPLIGLVGPTTNRLGNEAEIDTAYHTYGELTAFAETVATNGGLSPFDLEIGSMFCLAFRRSTYDRLGPVDERFRVGMFEDVDYSERARVAGLRVACAENVFVHHFGSATFGELAASGEFGPLFHENRRRWEEKWNRAWQPPLRRPNCINEQLRCEISRAVERWTLPESTIVVISKGDDELLRLIGRSGRRAWHFPQTADGTYAGHHPADSAAALAELDHLRAKGGAYLLIPSTSRWWLDHYREFAERVAREERRIMDQPQTCSIYALHDPVNADL